MYPMRVPGIGIPTVGSSTFQKSLTPAARHPDVACGCPTSNIHLPTPAWRFLISGEYYKVGRAGEGASGEVDVLEWVVVRWGQNGRCMQAVQRVRQ
eukprot:gene12638-biopygen8182